jgi:hypothetical protein
VNFVKQGINNTLRIKNIVGDLLEFWLVSTTGNKKIIVSVMAKIGGWHYRHPVGKRRA